MGWTNRLKRLENLLDLGAPRTEYRVAGKSRSEVHAEVLGRLFYRLEEVAPGAASALVEAAKSGEEVTSGESEEIRMTLGAIRCCERTNPGLPERLLKTVQNGGTTITEEIVFPDGRAVLHEETYFSEHGGRFCYRLDTIE